MVLHAFFCAICVYGLISAAAESFASRQCKNINYKLSGVAYWGETAGGGCLCEGGRKQDQFIRLFAGNVRTIPRIKRIICGDKIRFIPGRNPAAHHIINTYYGSFLGDNPKASGAKTKTFLLFNLEAS